ncbi:ShlB/FhaC/HecB family hemolysin secretion/activation protein [bacterium]|nr:ShlB/FhaC/HecB family hemolysin secretion/activation protein [bacterium]
MGFFLLSCTVNAVTVDQDAIEKEVRIKAGVLQDNLIIQDQNRRRYEESLRDARKKQSIPIDYGAPATASVILGELPSFNITDIELKGATFLADFEKITLVSPYLNRMITINDINQLAASVTDAYLKKGYVTTRTYLPKQSLKSGHLILEVHEGFIADIRLEGITSLQKDLAFFSVQRRPLNIWSLEQAMDQLNRLSSIQAVMQLSPAQDTGGTVVTVRNMGGRLGSASVRYDTVSDSQVQVIPTSVDLGYDNMLGTLDQWTVSYFQKFKDNTQYQNNLSCSVSQPMGSVTGRVAFSQFDYMTLVAGTNKNLITSGESITAKGSLDVMLFRAAKDKLVGTVELTNKSNQNFIEDTKIDTNSSSLTTLSLGLNNLWYADFGTMGLDLRYIRGLSSTMDSPTLDVGSAHQQFDKFTAEITLTLPISTAWFPVTLQGRLMGQYSPVALYASERLSIGDSYSTPGYEMAFSGDSGAQASLKLMYTPGFLGQNIGFYHGIYGGVVSKAGQWNDVGGHAIMTSIATGITYRDDVWSMDITLAKAVKASSGLEIPGAQCFWTLTRSF